MISASYQTQNVDGWEMSDQSREDELIRQVFDLLAQNRVSPKEGFLLAREIMLSSVEAYAKTNNLSPEDLLARIIHEWSGSDLELPPSNKKEPYMVGSGRGWVGNYNTTTENN
jgi:hypothetical protein